MIRWRAVTAVLWCIAAGVVAAPLTLHEAQQLLFRNNTVIRMAEVEREKAEAELAEARAAWLPTVEAKGAWQWLSERNSIAFSMPSPVPGNAPLNIDRTIGTNTRTELGIDCTYPLFTGFARKLDSEGKQEAIALRQAVVESTRNRTSLTLGLLYLQWQLSFKEAAVRRELCTSLDAVCVQTQERVNAGVFLRSRLLDAQARRRMAEVDLAGARQKTDSLRYELLALVASSDSAAVPDTTGFAGRLAAPSADAGVDSTRPELSAIRRGEAQVAITDKLLSYRYLPKLIGMAGVRYANPGLAMGDDRFMGYGIVGLQLTWNLFDGFRGKARERQLAHARQLLTLKYRQASDDFEKRLLQLQRQIDLLGRRCDAALEARDAASALAEALKQCIEAGTATQVEYLNALVGAAQAELMVVQLWTARDMASLQALYAAGASIEF
jgi:outer membrane protein TolC